MDKQIRDKLIKIIKKQSVCCNGNECGKCYYDGDYCVEERLADAIIESNMIIPEGAVVLTREEWEQRAYVNAMENELCKKCRAYIAEQFEKIRKETAEKYHDLTQKAIESVPHAPMLFEQAWKEKNDEICKEITEVDK